MPVSTEQILHPSRYAAHDTPTELAFGGGPGGPPLDPVRYEDDLGEFETRLLFQELLGDETEATLLATGWDGDRYAVLGERADVLVWYTLWDDARAADRFAHGLERAWARRRTGRRWEVKRLTVDGVPGVRLVDAPKQWAGWKAIPAVRVVSRN